MSNITYEESKLLEQFRELTSDGKALFLKMMPMLASEYSKKVISFRSSDDARILDAYEKLLADEIVLLRNYRKLNNIGKEDILNRINEDVANESFTMDDAELPNWYEDKVNTIRLYGVEKEDKFSL